MCSMCNIVFRYILFFLILFFLINVDKTARVEALAVKKPAKQKAPLAATIPTSSSAAATEHEKKPVPAHEASFMEAEDDANEENSNGHTSNILKPGCDPCPEGIRCVPQIQCPAHVRMKEEEKPQICDLAGGYVGFCCVTGQNHTADETDGGKKSRNAADGSLFRSDFVSMAIIEEARSKFEKLMHDIEVLPVQRGQPEFLHSMVFHSSPQEDMENFHISNNALEQVITTQMFTKKEKIPLDDIITNKMNINFKDTPLEKHCSQPHPCRDPRARYRSFDGSCNNALPHHSHWGAANQAMERLLPPAYDDGVWTPRMKTRDGQPLMGARQISRLLLTDQHRPHPKHNLMHMQMGQFIAHDVSQTASVRTESGELVSCCDSEGTSMLPKDKTHFACLPIQVEEDDDFYSEFSVRCMNFVRLSLAPNSDCKAGYGKQRSKVTHFLDASPVYGSNLKMMRELRTFHGGKLRMLNDFGHDLLPLTREKKTCESDEPGKSCFKSGDGRTNQMISLIVIHLIFAREHNRIADALAHINPQSNDEELFQEARRILIAELQHIIYNEYLPALIGPLQMKRFGLVPQHHGFSNDYSAEINPALTNEFSGAAFRMGHSSVDGKFHIQKPNGGGIQQQHGQQRNSPNDNIDEIINIPDVMFNPSRMRKRSFYDQMLNTLVTQPMQKVDTSVTQGLTQYLFRGHSPFGLDLAAFNIQRGRDQGLRPYNDYLELLGHRKLHSFKQLTPDVGRRLSQVYRSTDDIDLWVGGLLESAVDGGCVGNTFAEIIADQFSRFKRGDRYFYEYNKNVNPGGFTIDQLHEIRKVTMARLLCDNSDDWHVAPPAAFVRADFPGNEPVPCDSPHIGVVNLEAWRN